MGQDFSSRTYDQSKHCTQLCSGHYHHFRYMRVGQLLIYPQGAHQRINIVEKALMIPVKDGSGCRLCPLLCENSITLLSSALRVLNNPFVFCFSIADFVPQMLFTSPSLAFTVGLTVKSFNTFLSLIKVTTILLKINTQAVRA